MNETLSLTYGDNFYSGLKVIKQTLPSNSQFDKLFVR